MIQAPSAEAVAAYYSGLEGYWHPVAVGSDLDAEPLPVELLGRRLVLVRLEGEAVCFDDLCRHLGSALSIGEVLDGERLRCRYHGWTYDRTGHVVDIPARRGAPIPREAKVHPYAVREAYGLVWVRLGQERSPLLEYPEWSDEAFRKAGYRVYPVWAASATRIVMGALDDTHFPWVHPGTLGDQAHPEPPDHEVSVEGDRLVSTYAIEQPANLSLGSAAGAAGREEVVYTNTVTPTAIRLLKEAPAGRFVLFQVMQPLSYLSTRIYLQVARDFDLEPARDESYLEFEDGIQAQDQPVVESQRPWLLPPLSSRLMLYVRPADLPLIRFQKWMEELGIPEL